MTQTRQPTELQENKAEQPAGQSDSMLGSQAITKPEDNRIFLVDKTPTAEVKSLDLGKVDIYQSDAGKARETKALVDEYVVKPGDSVSRIAKQLAGKDGTPQDTERIVQEIGQLNGWKDTGHLLHPGDRVKVPGDKDAEAKPDDQRLREAKEKLTERAEEKFKDTPAQLAQFKENMRLFEERTERDKVSPTEVAKTYKVIDRLLEAKGESPLKPEQRKHLAEQIMSQAADPTTISQGAQSTCSMATVETRMYTRNPSDAARLVTDVALTGQYVATDERRVRVNPSAHNESRNGTTSDGGRSHASEIFQVTGVNLHIDQENRKTTPRGQLRYEQHTAKPGSLESGERIIDYGSKPPKVISYDPQISHENLGNLRDVYSAITGKKEEGIVVVRDAPDVDKSDGVTRVKSEQEFNDTLAQAKKDGKMPLIVAVDANVEPFWTDSGSGTAAGSKGGHVVTITDYSPGAPAKVTIDNQWGKVADHDATRPVAVHDLFQAVMGKSHAITELENDVEAAKGAGQVDTYKELDLARLKFQDGRITVDDFDKEVIRLAKAVDEMPDDDSKKRSTKKLLSTRDSVEMAVILRILKSEKKPSSPQKQLEEWTLETR